MIEYWKEKQGILAVWPNKWYDENKTLWTAYSKGYIVGCDPNYLKICTKATPEEYAEVAKEIEGKQIQNIGL